MKIMMLGWELPPYNSGGLGVACLQFCKSLAKQGADIEFIVPYEADHAVDFMKVTAAVAADPQEIQQAASAYDSSKFIHPDGRIEWFDMFHQQSRYEMAVARMVQSREFDVIHAHDWLTFRAGLLAKQLSGKPLIAHVHSVERDRAGGQPGNPLVREIEAIALQLADHVVAVSKLTKQMIVEDYGVPPENISVLYNSIDMTSLEPLEADNAYHYLAALRAQGYKIITNIGRLTVQKGLYNFLQAAKLVINKAPKTIFLIVGSGEQYHELLELTAELGIARNVIFTGFQRGKKWRDAFAIADLFVMPSISEPFGLTPLEAAFYGTPSLISKQSGVSEILHNALRVDFWDVQEMANQIAAVATSPALHDELQANVATELKMLSWDDTARGAMDIYERRAALRAVA